MSGMIVPGIARRTTFMVRVRMAGVVPVTV
jgi:hypothetical protein